MGVLFSENCRVGGCWKLKDQDMVHSLATVSLSGKTLRHSTAKLQAIFNKL